jgi:hypothetical protein
LRGAERQLLQNRLKNSHQPRSECLLAFSDTDLGQCVA